MVSAEESIFSGEAQFVALPGEAGELGIYPRHTPLITRIQPGAVRIEKADGTEEFVFVAGGMLEVQPNCVTVLSDTAIRGKDLDEEKANEAKARRRRSAEERQERHRPGQGPVRARRHGRADRGVAKIPTKEVNVPREARQGERNFSGECVTNYNTRRGQTFGSVQLSKRRGGAETGNQ